MRPHVVVVGGGYAGVVAARTAADARARTTLVDTDGQHDFLPRLAAVAAGTGPASDAAAPLDGLLHGVDVVTDTADAVDTEGQVVRTAGGRSLAYDALVLTVGAQVRAPDIPGLSANAWTLRTAGDALALRDRLAAAERLVVVGAGATGTQLAGEVTAARRDCRVALVEMTERILPSLPAAMARRAARVLVDRGVDVRTGVGLAEVAPHGAVLDDGSELPGLVVWSGGFTACGMPLLPDAPLDDAPPRGGRVVVDRCAQVPGLGPVFAAGDVAAHRGPGGQVLPQTAQVAVRAGALAGANAVRVARGRRARPGSLRHIGWVLSLGGGQAVAQVGPVVLADALTSRLAPVLHDAVDLRHLLAVGGLPAVVDHHQRPVSLPW